jgi:DNA-binding transcriptional LysR family regulator
MPEFKRPDPGEVIRRVDWRLLEYFRVAGKRQHITRAAEQLGTSQPTLSRALTRLEAEIGVTLFQRTGRSVRLSPEGRTFLDYIDRALQIVEDGRREMEDSKNSGRRSIALGFLRSLGAECVPKIVREFKELHRDVSFSFTSSNTAGLLEQLLDRELDLVFLSNPVDKQQFGWKRLASQELVLIVSSSHSLARKARIALRDVASEPFVTYKPGRGARDLTIELCRRAGFTPSIVLEADDPSVIRGFVSAGFGIAVTPPENTGPGVKAVRITEPVSRREIGIAWRKDGYMPAAVRVFRDFATSSGRRLSVRNKV